MPQSKVFGSEKCVASAAPDDVIGSVGQVHRRYRHLSWVPAMALSDAQGQAGSVLMALAGADLGVGLASLSAADDGGGRNLIGGTKLAG